MQNHMIMSFCEESRTFQSFSVETLILKCLRNQSCCFSDVDFCWLCSLSFDQSCLLINSLTASDFVVVDHSLTCVQLFATLWTAACPAPLSSTITQNLLRFVSIESVMLPNHLILCHSVLLLPSIFTSIWFLGEENQNFFPLYPPECFQPNLVFPSKTSPFVTSSEPLSFSPAIYTCLDTTVYSFLIKKENCLVIWVFVVNHLKFFLEAGWMWKKHTPPWDLRVLVDWLQGVITGWGRQRM